MKDLVEVIAKALVDNPEGVGYVKTGRQDYRDRSTVAENDMGKVIGKSKAALRKQSVPL